MRGPIGPRTPQLELDVAGVGQLETCLRDGRPQGVLTDPLEPSWLVRRYTESGVQIEAVVMRVARADPWRFGDGSQEVTAAADAGAGPRAQRPPLHRRRGEPPRGLAHRPPTHPAYADVILLEDGTYIEGTVVAETARELTIETSGKVSRKITVKKADIKKHVRDNGAGDSEVRPGGLDGPGSVTFEPSLLTGRVLFVIDVSGSMRIGKRYELARESLYTIVAELPKKTEFDVHLFSDVPVSLFERDFLRASKRMKKRIKKHMGKRKVKLTKHTDLMAALKGALKTKKVETIVLYTDGIPTAGVLDPQAILARVRKLRKATKKFNPPALHVRAVTGDEFRDPKVEDKEAAEEFLRRLAAEKFLRRLAAEKFLRRLAAENQGTYVEIAGGLGKPLRALSRRTKTPRSSCSTTRAATRSRRSSWEPGASCRPSTCSFWTRPSPRATTRSRSTRSKRRSAWSPTTSRET